MIAKFETSKGTVKIEIEKGIWDYIEDSIEKSIKVIHIVDVIEGKDYINNMYNGCIGSIFHKGRQGEGENLGRELYFMRDWEVFLQKNIEMGNIWVHIDLIDGYYGSPEYKLELV